MTLLLYMRSITLCVPQRGHIKKPGILCEFRRNHEYQGSFPN